MYYPVRHHLIQHMVNSIQRLGFSPTATLEHRKLAVELAEVIIKWELHGIKEEDEKPEEIAEKKRIQSIPGASQPMITKIEPGMTKPIDRVHTDAVLNYLLRLACQVNDPAPPNPANPPASSPGELLSRRCVLLLKTALKPDIWPQPIDLKLVFFDKILQSIESTNPNIGNICTALELLTFLLTVLKKEQILVNYKPLQKALGACINSSNGKIVKLVHTFIQKLMAIFPVEGKN